MIVYVRFIVLGTEIQQRLAFKIDVLWDESVEKIVDLPCKCGRIYCKLIDDDDNKNEIVTFTCECGEQKMILIAERCILK